MRQIVIPPSGHFVDRTADRKKLERDLRAFKRSGGKIEVLPSLGLDQKSWQSQVVRDSIAVREARKKLARKKAKRAELYDDTDDDE